MTQSTRKTKQELITEFRNSEILSAARKVFAEKGFADATVDQIAEQAGIAKGTIYLYFSSKREIYIAALREGVQEVSAAIRKKVDATPTLEGKINAYIDTKLRYIDSNLDFFRIFHAEFGSCVHVATFDNEVSEHFRWQVDFLAEMLRAGMETGEAREISVDAVAWGISEMSRGVALRRVMGWSKVPVEQDIDELTRMIWNGIRKS